jgi:hypothetical protein
MANAKKTTKNNPSSRGNTSKTKMVTSSECENCKEQCTKGKNYLKIFKQRLFGTGVPCSK